MRYLLGVDVGTTGTKTILFRQDGRIIGQAYRAYPTATPKVGFSEQNPLDWWNAVCETVKEVCSDPQIRSGVAAIALSTQGGTTAALDAEGNAVRPAIVWNDRRCQEELRELQQQSLGVDVYQLSGWKASASMPMLHCRWLQKHEPENFQKIRMLLSVPDYLAWKMTGTASVDISNAGICRFADIRQRKYCKELLDYAGLKEAEMAPIVGSGEPIGTLTKAAAEELNLSTDVMLVSGAHDQYAVSLGAGACRAGDVLIGTGTSWVVTSLSDQPDFDSGLAQSVPAVPGLWGSLKSLSSGGVCLEWWRKNLAREEGGELLPFGTINEEVAKRKAGADGLFFYPFSGHFGKDKAFHKASFVGMDLSHDRFHLARAIMEGVAFQSLWMLDYFRAQPSDMGLKLAGGAAKSRLWCQIVANTANMPVRIPETADLACVGAAILAGVGSGVYANAEEGYRRLAVADSIIEPEADQVPLYQEMFARYKETAKLLGNLYEQLSG